MIPVKRIFTRVKKYLEFYRVFTIFNIYPQMEVSIITPIFYMMWVWKKNRIVYLSSTGVFVAEGRFQQLITILIGINYRLHSMWNPWQICSSHIMYRAMYSHLPHSLVCQWMTPTMGVWMHLIWEYHYQLQPCISYSFGEGEASLLLRSFKCHSDLTTHLSVKTHWFSEAITSVFLEILSISILLQPVDKH